MEAGFIFLSVKALSFCSLAPGDLFPLNKLFFLGELNFFLTTAPLMVTLIEEISVFSSQKCRLLE